MPSERHQSAARRIEAYARLLRMMAKCKAGAGAATDPDNLWPEYIDAGGDS